MIILWHDNWKPEQWNTKQAAISMRRSSKHIPSTKSKQTVTEEPKKQCLLRRIYSEDQWSPQFEVGGYHSGVLSCTVRCHYQVMASEDTVDWKDLVLAVVICSVYARESVVIICSYKLLVFNKSKPNPSSHWHVTILSHVWWYTWLILWVLYLFDWIY
jgi:hypothetical protein